MKSTNVQFKLTVPDYPIREGEAITPKATLKTQITVCIQVQKSLKIQIFNYLLEALMLIACILRDKNNFHLITVIVKVNNVSVK